jgi:hypothetical protein
MPSRIGPADLPDAGTPLVVTIERAAVHLGVPPERVAQVAATLDPWGTHASGEPVWRLRELERRLGRGRRRRRKLPWSGRFLTPRRDNDR